MKRLLIECDGRAFAARIKDAANGEAARLKLVAVTATVDTRCQEPYLALYVAGEDADAALRDLDEVTLVVKKVRPEVWVEGGPAPRLDKRGQS